MKLRWPRGRYNGQKIGGFKISFEVNVLSWDWKPIFHWKFGYHYFIWLCFTVRFETSYQAKTTN
ncbi:hypothetical protein [uncultured Endozoicomonas sp.]|uniref:hypothetical protein n=1 Tax=uncultured Endozoicomonas sp. TaxID=432652 RepID=UPI0026025C1F|nr:hypothetical protein [uncultured Endozoicomonas sp.]